MSFLGGFPTELAGATHSHGLAWHQAEDAIYFVPNGTGGIWKVPVRGGAAVEVTTVDKARGEQSHDFPLFSPDGRTLVFSVNATSAEFDEEEVSLLNLQTGTRETVRTGGDAVGFTDHGELAREARRPDTWAYRGPQPATRSFSISGRPVIGRLCA